MAANTDGTAASFLGELPDIPTLGSFTLEQILQYHLSVVDVIGKHEMRQRALSSQTAFLSMLETLNKLLDLFNAAKATYFNPKYFHSSLQQNTNEPGLTCLKSAVSIGRQTIQEEDSDVISRTIIKFSVIQLGKDVADFKLWFCQFRNSTNLDRHIDGEILEMGGLEGVLNKLWAFVAATRK